MVCMAFLSLRSGHNDEDYLFQFTFSIDLSLLFKYALITFFISTFNRAGYSKPKTNYCCLTPCALVRNIFEFSTYFSNFLSAIKRMLTIINCFFKLYWQCGLENLALIWHLNCKNFLSSIFFKYVWIFWNTNVQLFSLKGRKT